MSSHLLLLDYTKTICQLIFTCFNLEGGDRVLVLVLVDTQQSSQRSITLRSISRQQISPKIL